MPPSMINYPILIREASIAVIRQVLGMVSNDSDLPGEHHFVLAIATEHPQLIMPESIKKQFPEQLVLVLQNQFHSLTTDDHAIEVVVQFGGVDTFVRIPFAALVAFADPAGDVQIPLPFVATEGEGVQQEDTNFAIGLPDASSDSHEGMLDHAPATLARGEKNAKPTSETPEHLEHLEHLEHSETPELPEQDLESADEKAKILDFKAYKNRK